LSISFSGKPPAAAVEALQVENLSDPLHAAHDHAYEANCDGGQRLILGFVKLAVQFLGSYLCQIGFGTFEDNVVIVE
jgi:hypothetical protein